MRSIVLVILSIALLHADEGMWTFNQFPAAKVQQKYGFAPTQQWLDHARLASVRLTEGCSASFVSSKGLVLTNYHCAVTCIQQISSKEHDYTATGFAAQSEAEEAKCPGQEANVLVEISDVTARLKQKTAGLADKAAFEARRGEIAKIEKECATSDALRCEVVTLYGGGVYDLYKYRRYQDVRLVFAPEFMTAFFGGDPDNFMFPRYNLDASFIRVYENGQPLKSEHYFPISKSGPKDGELTFVSGHPGGTNRQHTIDMLEMERDFTRPNLLFYLSELRAMLTEFQTRGEEQRRISQDELMFVENSLKAGKGEYWSLLEKPFFDQKIAEERDFQKRVNADAKLKQQYGGAWAEIAAIDKRARQLFLPYTYLESGRGFDSDLYTHAKRLVRMAVEYAKPNAERLPVYTDARKPELQQATLSAAPIYPEMEIEKLTWSLDKLREALGPDDAAVKQIFGERSPREIATQAVRGTKLTDVAVRKALMEGGQAAVNASSDPMIALAKLVDPIGRKVRKQWEDEVESARTRALEKLGAARFAVYGTSAYPDATFTLRLSYGTVKGWLENGKQVMPFTTLGGAYDRATGRDPFALAPSWLKAKSKVNLATPFNFVTTNDIIGGNSGSPVINKEGQLIGLVFDGNIHSLGGNYGFDEALNRTVAVDTRAILEALRNIYGATRVLSEVEARP
ncbi:MAG TPA: S46 family peptidase [Candidatus Solibacter sp.]|nr:S46 family peptidase [Candidatus Solibacter sp.]